MRWFTLLLLTFLGSSSSFHAAAQISPFLREWKPINHYSFRLKSYLTGVLLQDFPNLRQSGTLFQDFVDPHGPVIVGTVPLYWQKLGNLKRLIIETPHNVVLVSDKFKLLR